MRLNNFFISVSKDQKEGGESLPEEKISNTLETSATTAPTLPEDEKVEDHIVEEEKPQTEDAQEIVEEKYIQEDTKEDKKKEILDVVLQELPVIPTHVYVEGNSLPKVCDFISEVPRVTRNFCFRFSRSAKEAQRRRQNT